MRKTLLSTLTGLLLGGLNLVVAQPLPYPLVEQPLTDLKAFKAPAANWKIVGAVAANPDVKYDLQASPGQGVLVNLPTEKAKADLFTNWEHGDLELEVDFMTARESNSGIYLMGRYELQIYDSYTQPLTGSRLNSGKHDCAALYERWDDTKPEGQKGYQGRPARINATRAPGLWQHYRIVFQAPRFDAQGRKTQNAKFVQVIHNGVLVHENVELTGPTRGSAFEQEAPTGPLRIQGDHGPVAFRRLRYKNVGTGKLALEKVTYDFWSGAFNTIDSVLKTPPQLKGQAAPAGIDWQLEQAQEFAYAFTGTLRTTVPGRYIFSPVVSGKHLLSVNGQVLHKKDDDISWRGEYGAGIDLKPGLHQVRLVYSKQFNWQPGTLGLFVEGPGLAKQPLHAPASLPPPDPRPLMVVKPEDGRPYVLRSFIGHQGKTYPYGASVGFPSQLHYALDLTQGRLLYVWRGEFVDASPIWYERGGGNVPPAGSVINFGPQPLVASLASPTAAFPDTVASLRFSGLELNRAGQPIFSYQMDGLTYTDLLTPDAEGRVLTRELSFKDAPQNLYCRVAAAAKIEDLGNGRWAINDREFYLQQFEGSSKPTLRNVPGGQEILLPIMAGSSTVKYQLVF
ncbi:MAG: DUF1080 domain-containing protein [Bernardetiaceae bacterium]|jgi:hypothetical protein|nr:DUF1080 domain-containing protein [Bernardetiaceae bacterium]